MAAVGGGLIFGLLRGRSGGGDSALLPFAAVQPAPEPFAGFATARVGLGDRCLTLLVAGDEASRETGLRGRRSTAPYDGMLFAFPTEDRFGFTMAGVPVPLDITWFGADGRPVDRARMEPCPDGTDADCPVYRSDRPFRYALERGAAGPTGGALGSC